MPAVQAMGDLLFDESVTFLAGENGSGKSTVLEAIAVACGCPEDGGPSNQNLKGPRYAGEGLHGRVQPSLTGVPVGGAWFLRAETFFDLTTAAENTAGVSRPDYEAAQLLADFGGRVPHALSHGQAFLGLFEGRMGGQSLWFMDEPEAPLSFRSQLALLSLLDTLTKAGSQFVVATHSPILLAMPGATIYELGSDGVRRRTWEELELVRDVRGFLESPERYLRHLFD